MKCGSAHIVTHPQQTLQQVSSSHLLPFLLQTTSHPQSVMRKVKIFTCSWCNSFFWDPSKLGNKYHHPHFLSRGPEFIIPDLLPMCSDFSFYILCTKVPTISPLPLNVTLRVKQTCHRVLWMYKIKEKENKLRKDWNRNGRERQRSCNTHINLILPIWLTAQKNLVNLKINGIKIKVKVL